MTPTCPACRAPMSFIYAVRIPARDADVRVFQCRGCREGVAQTWVGETFKGEGPMPLFAELRQ